MYEIVIVISSYFVLWKIKSFA